MALKNNIYVKVGLFYFAFSCLHILLYRVMDITFGINSDPFNFTYTLLSEIKRNLLMGHLPMWFSQIYTGLPLLFVGSYDIRSIIFLPWLNVMDVMVLMASITMFISGVGSFWSLKKIFGYSNQATFIASIFWTFSGIFVGYYYDQVINPVYIWSLIAFASLIEFDKNPKWYFCILLLAVFEQLLTCRFDGIEMTTLTSVVLLFLLVFAPNPTSFINSDKGLLSGMLEWLKKRVMVVLLVGLISVLLLSPILFEQWVLVRNSFRTLITVEPLVYDFSLINFFGLVPFSDEFFKFERGLNLYGHVGIVFFLLAIVGVFAGPRRKQAVYFFVAAFLVSFLMYDVKFFGYTLFDLYRLLPGHGSLRYSQRFIPAVTLFLCVPIMGGWEVIQFRLFKATEKTKLQILTTFMAVFFLVLGVILANQVTQVGWNRASLLLDILLADFIALCLIIGYVRGKKSSSYLLCSLVALWIIKAYCISCLGISDVPLRNLKAIQKNPIYQEVLQQLNLIEPDPASYRVFVILPEGDELSQSLVANGIHTLSGYHPMVGLDFAAFVRLVTKDYFYQHVRKGPNFNPYVYGVSNVKYFVGSPDYFGKNNVSQIVKKIMTTSDGSMSLYENLKFWPRAYMVHSAKSIEPSHEIEFVSNKLWTQPEWFIKNAAITSCDNCHESDSALQNSDSDEVKIVSYQNNVIRISVRTDSPGHLILNDKFDSVHWRAHINDQLQDAPILRANGIFRAVSIDQDTKFVQFEFVPPTSFLFGTLLGLVILLIALRRLI